MVEGECKGKAPDNLPRGSSRVVTSMDKEIDTAEDSRLTVCHAGMHGIGDRDRCNGDLEEEEEEEEGGNADSKKKVSCDGSVSKSENATPSCGAAEGTYEGYGSPFKDRSHVLKGVCNTGKEVGMNPAAGAVSMTGVMRGLCNPMKGPSSRRTGSRPRQTIAAPGLGERLVLLNRTTREMGAQAIAGTGATTGTGSRTGTLTGTASGISSGTKTGTGTSSGTGTASGPGTRTGTVAGNESGNGMMVYEVRAVRRNLESCASQQARQSGQAGAALATRGATSILTGSESASDTAASENRGAGRDLASGASHQVKQRVGNVEGGCDVKEERTLGDDVDGGGAVDSGADVAVQRVAAEPTQQRVLGLESNASVLARSIDCGTVARLGESGECTAVEGVWSKGECSGVAKLGEDHLQMSRVAVMRGVGNGGVKVNGHPHPFAAGMKLGADVAREAEGVGRCERGSGADAEMTRGLPQFAWMESFGAGVSVQKGSEAGYKGGMAVAGAPLPVDGAQGKVPPVVACAVKGRVQLSWRDSPCLMGSGRVGGKAGKGGGSAFVDIASRRCGGESRSSSERVSERGPSCRLGSWSKWRADAEAQGCARREVADAGCEMQDHELELQRDRELEMRRMSNGNQSGSSNESTVGEFEESKPGAASRACVGCGTMKTPLWRSGPSGPKSLCNACGIRHKKASKLRASMSGEDNTEPMIRITLAAKSIKSGPRKRKASAREQSVNTVELPVEHHVSGSVEVCASVATDSTAPVEGCCPSSSPQSQSDHFPLKNKMWMGMSARVMKKGRTVVVDPERDASRAMAGDERCRSSSCSEAGEGDHTRSSADSCVTLQGSPPSMVSQLMKGAGCNAAAAAAYMKTSPSSTAVMGLFPRVSSGQGRPDTHCVEPPIGWGGRRARAGERMSHKDWARKRKSSLEGPEIAEDTGVRTKLGGRGPSDEVEGAILLMTLFKGCPVRTTRQMPRKRDFPAKMDKRVEEQTTWYGADLVWS
ncbi:hypothetical protein CBR_g37571 [Chara braunii]|uniref:GATA-type domain-containing protein n=1 Tax=Chara braunii TaxID=69332 RepID=A0A388LN48_CHABU|nr:hypothetical protein CBR_g37571 [Chara braunii]|eukprot:GBG83770.1 hypothetical protein CBR_g37571 [Chara braunii]